MTFEDWLKFVLQSNVAAAMVVGGFGLLTLKLGVGKYASEKWWEKKASAYAAAIDALHGMYDLSLAQVEAIEASQEISAERIKSLQAANIAGLSEVRKGASIGSFVMSKIAANILSNVLKDFEGLAEPSIHEFYDRRAVILSDAITAITAEAKRDLKTR